MYVVRGRQLVTMRNHFCTPCVFILKALEVIAHDLHTNDYDEDVTTGWEGKYKADASALLTGI